MAELVFSTFLSVLYDKLVSPAFETLARYMGIDSEVKKCEKTLFEIRALLEDASQKEITNEYVKAWLNRLQHLAYDIDDILDDLETEAMGRELTEEYGPSTSKVRKLAQTSFHSFSVSSRLHDKLSNITTKLEDLEKEKGTLGLMVLNGKPINRKRTYEPSFPDESSIVGREHEREALLKLLLEETCHQNFNIVPIVGMGGIGKTTLARLLFNETQVKDHFALKAWVCVSDEFDVFKISKSIFESITGINKEFSDLNLLQTALRQQLMEKRFLLVLDDVWSEKCEKWDSLVSPFCVGALGSKIIMTTRNEQLLNDLGYNHVNRLQSLLYNDALTLFCQHALGVNRFDSHSTLRSHGEGIVKKCKGLPLALKALGRLLRTKTSEQEWKEVLDSDIWSLQMGDEIIPALRLSYHDLSACLKQLFAYCSLFPKGYLFDKEELVLLWMAEGFLDKSTSRKSTMELLGEEYFKELLSRSFFQPAPNDESLFVMHDLMNDLATFVAGDFFLRLDHEMEIEKDVMKESLEKHRHMSFVCEFYNAYKKLKGFERAKSLRTFIRPSTVDPLQPNGRRFGRTETLQPVAHRGGVQYLSRRLKACRRQPDGEPKATADGLTVSLHVRDTYKFPISFSSKILVNLLHELPLLRVICLSNLNISEIPDSIGSLKHLRYLNLANTRITSLPESVCNLYNLQTIIVFGCTRLTYLPNSFLKLKKLRHFDIRDTPLLIKMPLGIGELKSLQTLSKIIIGEDNRFAITDLKNLKNLHGQTSIQGLDKVHNAMHAREANLFQRRFTELKLEWSDKFDGSRKETLEKEILNMLKPDYGVLKKLRIVSYGGIEFPNWVGDPSFIWLSHVSIRGCKKCTSLPPLGQLSSLKELFIEGMDAVKGVGCELLGTGCAFSSLRIISFQNMKGWKEWSANGRVGGDAIFPCLLELRIDDCPNLDKVSLKALPSLKSLEVRNCKHGVLRRLVPLTSSITKLEVSNISRVTGHLLGGIIGFLGEVEQLSINFCDEIGYLWESNVEACKVLVNLRVLKVHSCKNLTSLGEKEDDKCGSNVTSLTQLDIWRCTRMKHCNCPNSVEMLSMSYCDSLASISFMKREQNLKSLKISVCKKLWESELEGGGTEMMLNNANMAMLQVLHIHDWPNLKSVNNLSHFINLNSLTIRDCQSMASFSDSELTKLTLLKRLTIESCPGMDASFPRGHWPPNLCYLRIGNLKNPISEWCPQNFPISLVELSLIGGSSDDMSNWSQLSHLLPSSLTRLRIEGFEKLESLSEGLQHLTSLQHLEIISCPMMKYLPEMLFPLFLSFIVWACPNLQEMCMKGGSYWHQISHIPLVQIWVHSNKEETYNSTRLATNALYRIDDTIIMA
ncbi:hypothetical protein OSB04_019881 [Centaurea solstitialis]|uniref:Uncharacterized protein n=1 Tax=Centaurea solstitialis TaxID=347529 RepID=A0AA38SYT0_9ASTR|nr:hypothetical protein OSB04_019881 [Centaurea solstitialis]